MTSEDNAVLIRVKSASHPSCEDVEFTCDPKLTSVREVKEKIRTLYSFHPDIADQRLIYAGHLLDDLQVLTDVFGLNGTSSSTMSTSQSNYQHCGPYTIHLACTSKSYVGPTQRARNDNQRVNSHSQTSFTPQIPSPMMQDPRLNMSNQNTNHFEVNANGNSGVSPEFYALHQLYVEQMNAYMRNWNLAYGIRDVNFPAGLSGPESVPHANPNVQANNPPPQPGPNAPAQNERPLAEAGNLVGIGVGGLVGNAAQGNDDDENQRDLLDWAYTLSRVVLILSVVYYYSNFTRFLLVVIFTAAIAIFQRRPAQNQDAQPAQIANVPADRQGNNNNNNNNAANPVPPDDLNRPNRDNIDAGSNNDGNAQAAEANVVADAGQHRLAYYRDVTWTFLTTFFTSLIPEMPQHN